MNMKEFGGYTEEGNKGEANGSNYVGALERVEEHSYITLCGYCGSKVSCTIFVGFDVEIIKFSVSVLLRPDSQ